MRQIRKEIVLFIVRETIVKPAQIRIDDVDRKKLRKKNINREHQFFKTGQMRTSLFYIASTKQSLSQYVRYARALLYLSASTCAMIG